MAKKKNESKTTRRKFTPKSENQEDYIRSIVENDIVFCTGPAGSGKTACAVGLAVEYLMMDKVSRIIVTRPTIGTDEDYTGGIGYLPGDILEKMDPYLRPIYDEVKTYVDQYTLKDWLHKEVLEIAPLDFMRGRTFHNAFVIMDEAQNATHNQLKMFTTRLGRSSKMVINGDIQQHDRYHSKCALKDWITNIVPRVNGVGLVKLDKMDIIRHPLVGDILTSVENFEIQHNIK